MTSMHLFKPFLLLTTLISVVDASSSNSGSGFGSGSGPLSWVLSSSPVFSSSTTSSSNNASSPLLLLIVPSLFNTRATSISSSMSASSPSTFNFNFNFFALIADAFSNTDTLSSGSISGVVASDILSMMQGQVAYRNFSVVDPASPSSPISTRIVTLSYLAPVPYPYSPQGAFFIVDTLLSLNANSFQGTANNYLLTTLVNEFENTFTVNNAATGSNNKNRLWTSNVEERIDYTSVSANNQVWTVTLSIAPDISRYDALCEQLITYGRVASMLHALSLYPASMSVSPTWNSNSPISVSIQFIATINVKATPLLTAHPCIDQQCSNANTLSFWSTPKNPLLSTADIVLIVLGGVFGIPLIVAMCLAFGRDFCECLGDCCSGCCDWMGDQIRDCRNCICTPCDRAAEAKRRRERDAKEKREREQRTKDLAASMPSAGSGSSGSSSIGYSVPYGTSSSSSGNDTLVPPPPYSGRSSVSEVQLHQLH